MKKKIGMQTLQICIAVYTIYTYCNLKHISSFSISQHPSTHRTTTLDTDEEDMTFYCIEQDRGRGGPSSRTKL